MCTRVSHVASIDHPSFSLVHSVGYILNVTREIDNFYPEVFKYLNIRYTQCTCTSIRDNVHVIHSHAVQIMCYTCLSLWCHSMYIGPVCVRVCCRLYDVPDSELIKHWGKTYRFIKEAKYVVIHVLTTTSYYYVHTCTCVNFVYACINNELLYGSGCTLRHTVYMCIQHFIQCVCMCVCVLQDDGYQSSSAL